MATNKPAAKPEQTTAVAAYDYGQDAGVGFEGQTREDRLVPFLQVVQPSSPLVTEKSIQPGLLYNSVTEETYKDLLIIPVKTEHVFVEWVPRAKGGGFVAEHRLDDPMVMKLRATGKFGALVTEDGNDLVESFKVYAVMDLGEGRLEPIVVAFESTKIPVYRKFNTQLARFQIALPDGRKVAPPLWAHLTRLSTVAQKNDKGSWFNYVWAPAEGELTKSLLTPDDPRYQVGKEYHGMIAAETMRADYSAPRAAREDDADDRTPF